jgi:hypothetical protein
VIKRCRGGRLIVAAAIVRIETPDTFADIKQVARCQLHSGGALPSCRFRATVKLNAGLPKSCTKVRICGEVAKRYCAAWAIKQVFPERVRARVGHPGEAFLQGDKAHTWSECCYISISLWTVW